MAVRPVFVPFEKAPFYQAVNVEFEWNGGFAKSQKQKNIKAIHEGFSIVKPGKKVLEISSKSMQEHGEDLSAFFLKKYVPSLDKKVLVECVYHSAKTFAKGGPYRDILEKTPREAKRDERLKNSGGLVCFTFEDETIPLEPKTAFYNYIYMNALLENEDLAATVLQYDAFTDIEFNPNKGHNCQAKAAAAFVALSRMELIEKIRDFESFMELYSLTPQMKVSRSQNKDEQISVVSKADEKSVEKPNLTDIEWLIHKKYGKGHILSADEKYLMVDFPGIGQKKLGTQWCVKNCLME